MDDRWQQRLASALQILGNDEWRLDEQRQSAATSIIGRKIFLRKSHKPSPRTTKWPESEERCLF